METGNICKGVLYTNRFDKGNTRALWAMLRMREDAELTVTQ